MRDDRGGEVAEGVELLELARAHDRQQALDGAFTVLMVVRRRVEAMGRRMTMAQPPSRQEVSMILSYPPCLL